MKAKRYTSVALRCREQQSTRATIFIAGIARKLGLCAFRARFIMNGSLLGRRTGGWENDHGAREMSRLLTGDRAVGRRPAPGHRVYRLRGEIRAGHGSG